MDLRRKDNRRARRNSTTRSCRDVAIRSKEIADLASAARIGVASDAIDHGHFKDDYKAAHDLRRL